MEVTFFGSGGDTLQRLLEFSLILPIWFAVDNEQCDSFIHIP